MCTSAAAHLQTRICIRHLSVTVPSLPWRRVVRGTVGEWTVTKRTADMTDGLRKAGLRQPLLGGGSGSAGV